MNKVLIVLGVVCVFCFGFTNTVKENSIEVSAELFDFPPNGNITRPLLPNEARFIDCIMRVMEGMNSNEIGVTAIEKGANYNFNAPTTIHVSGDNFNYTCSYNNLNTFITVPTPGVYFVTISRDGETGTIRYTKTF